MLRTCRQLSILIILTCLVAATRVSAQVPDVQFWNLGLNQGLSNPYVLSLLQDSKGYLWMGTKDGLNVYDGYTLRVYRKKDGLSSNHIQALYEDREGMLWIGTYDGGLCRFDRQTGNFVCYRHDPRDARTLQSNNVYAIHQDKKGRLWIGTFGGGLSLFKPATQSFQTYKENPAKPGSLANNSVFSVHEDQAGRLWLGTFGGGLAHFDAETEKFTAYVHHPEEPYSLPGNDIYCVYEDRAGRLWMGTSGKGLSVFDRATGRFTTYQHDPANPASISSNYVLSVQEDDLGMLWVGTRGGGLCRFDPAKDLFTSFQHSPAQPKGIPHNDINVLMTDRSGSLWIGTDGGGVSRFETSHLAFHSYVSGTGQFEAHSVTALYEDSRKNVWIGTFNDGLYQFSPDRKQFVSFSTYFPGATELSEDVITAICEDKQGRMWFGTGDNGLFLFDPDGRTLKKYVHDPGDAGSLSSNSVETLYLDRKGNLWIGTYGGGLCSYSHITNAFTSYRNDPNNPKSISGNAVKVIYEDASGLLWIGNKETGLSVFDPARKTFVNYRHLEGSSESLSSNSITAVVEGKDSTVWIGTFGGGISRFNRRTQKFSTLTTQDGLPDQVICGLMADNWGDIWMSTTKGLSRIGGTTGHVTHFTVSEGLYGNEFVQWSYHQSRSGELFFGGADHFVAFRPADLQEKAYVAPVYLSSFRLFDKPQSFSQALSEMEVIELNYDDNFFSFEFVLLNFLDPEKNQYAYRMDGFDKDWNYIGNRRFASYTNLDAGEYVFRVKAADKRGIWNEAGTSIRLIIHPAWYHTWWFRTLVALSIIGAGWSYYRHRIRIVEQQKTVLEVQVAERTADLQEEKAKVEDAYQKISLQKENLEQAYGEINLQKEELQRKSTHITSSINYAKRIQEAILPMKDEIRQALPQSFILFKPRDIVSGDFYWFAKKNDCLLIAAIDCTGHGVPGAFMSMIGNSLLNQLVNEQQITNPAEILRQLHQGVRKALKQEESDDNTPDGMDIAICAIQPCRRVVEFAGANRPLFYLSQGRLAELKPTGASIGGLLMEGEGVFTQETLRIEHPTTFYLFTDGYADQFGGAVRRKFMLKNLKQLLLDMQSLSFEEQKNTLDQTIESWRADQPQTDDMLVIGFQLG